MCIDLYNMVNCRTVGSQAAKHVLLNMASKAQTDGTSIFPSQATIARETELSDKTVQRAIAFLLVQKLIVKTGERPCKNGYTVVYALNLDQIAALPKWEQSQTSKGKKISTTGVTMTPVHSAPGSPCLPTGVTMPPDGGHHDRQTILEPPMNLRALEREIAASLPNETAQSQRTMKGEGSGKDAEARDDEIGKRRRLAESLGLPVCGRDFDVHEAQTTEAIDKEPKQAFDPKML